MNTLSSLYRELSPGEIDSIVARHFAPLTLANARLLSGGLFNTTYMLALSDGQQLVLRAGPVNRHLLMAFEHGMMRAEAHVYSLCRAQGIPVSHVRALSTDRALVDRDYMIVDFINGRPLYGLDLDAGTLARLMREAGEFARRMHSITGARYGHVSQILSGGGYDSWRAAVLGEFEDWARIMRPLDMYSPDELAALEALFKRMAPLMDDVTQAQLVHADLWAGNVLVSGEGCSCKVTAIIDADRALFGDAEFEFTMGMGLNPDFLSGYGRAAADARPGAELKRAALRRSLYSLMHLLQDGYVWRYQYNDRANSDSCRMRALDALNALGEVRTLP